MKRILTLLAAAALIGCQPASEPESASVNEPSTDTTASQAAMMDSGLAAILDAMPDEAKARYQYRHPQETLEFFGIEPGMTVVEGLPGGGWYTKILLPYLGEDGHVIGASYALDMYQLFSFADEEFMERMRGWTALFPELAEEWGGENGAGASAFLFGSMPDEMAGTADAVLMIRAFHNLARWQAAGEGDYLDEALAEMYSVLKPGGVLGIVQHAALEDRPDEWADGSNGYLKKSFLIEAAETAGFEFVAESAINENPNDQATEGDGVWRLPPSYNGSRDDPEAMEAMTAIGESNRMTLKFVKK